MLGTPRSRSGTLVGGRARTAPSVGPAPGGPGQCVSLSLPGAGLEGRWPRAKALARNQSSASKHRLRRASTEQRATRVPGRRLPPCSMAMQGASGHGERPWNPCLSLLPRKVELRLAKTFLSSLAWGREGTQWNLLSEDAHSDKGRESNSRTRARVPFAPSRGSLRGRGRT